MRQRLLLPLTLLLVAGLTACGNGEEDVAADTDVVDEDVAADTDVEDDTAEFGTEEQATLVGLEVTVTGNVSEVVDPTAFRVDKDGLGQDQQDAVDEGAEADDDTEALDDAVAADEDLLDYDYYDYEYFTFYDEEFGDEELVEEGVLVVDVTETDVTVTEAVQVTGTVRQFEQTELEEIFGIELDDELYELYEEQFVIVADSVSPVPTDASETASPMATEGGQ